MTGYYVRRINEVRAVQWTGENLSAINDLAPGRFQFLPSENEGESPCALLRVSLGNAWHDLYVGSWVVKDERGHVWVCSDTLFRSGFAPLTMSEPAPAA